MVKMKNVLEAKLKVSLKLQSATYGCRGCMVYGACICAGSEDSVDQGAERWGRGEVTTGGEKNR